MNDEVKNIIESLLGKICCRQEVGEYKSLSLGFGEKVYHSNKRLKDTFYGEWELGSYYCAWRILKDKKVICGYSDYLSDVEALNEDIKEIDFGRIISIEELSSIDIRINFDTGIQVDFLGTISDDDELFHIFCPHNIYVELSYEGDWIVGKSDEPVK